MDRNTILSEFENLSVSEHDYLCSVLDYYEGVFNEIATTLKRVDIESLDNIVDAQIIAENAGRDLY